MDDQTKTKIDSLKGVTPSEGGFAYLIMAHHKREQLLRLLNTLRQGSPEAHIFLHHDAKVIPPPQASLDDLNVRLVNPCISVGWGDTSQVDAVLAGIRFAVANCRFSWLSVISGQDYPVRPLATIETELGACQFDAFVKASPAGPYTGRYLAHFWALPRFPYCYRIPMRLREAFSRTWYWLNCRQSLVRIESAPRGMPSRIGIYRPLNPFGKDFVCYKGSDWFTLSRTAAEYLLEYGRKHPSTLNYYSRTYIPSESYFQTVLWNAKSLRVCNENRRYIRWDHGNTAHPATLTMQHFDAMISSGKDFGRKFDMDVDAKVLDRLDEVVIGPQKITKKSGSK